MLALIPYNTMIVLLGTGLFGLCAGVVGTFAVLRKRSLAGDALAHAAFPGVCLAFMFMQERYLAGLLIGAFLSGLAGIFVISILGKTTRIKEDTAIGIVLSLFYGLGVVFLHMIQNQKTAGSKAGLKSFILGKTAGMSADDLYLITGASLLCLILVAVLFKEFKLISFDADFAFVQGWPSLLIDLLLMGMIALTVVVGLPAVGIVLVAASLIIPASAARFWTNDFPRMITLSAIFGLFSGAVGSLVSAQWNIPTGPAIILSGTILFLASMLFAPKKGVLAKRKRQGNIQQEHNAHNLLMRICETLEPGVPNEQIFFESMDTYNPRTSADLSSWRDPWERLESDHLIEVNWEDLKSDMMIWLEYAKQAGYDKLRNSNDKERWKEFWDNAPKTKQGPDVILTPKGYELGQKLVHADELMTLFQDRYPELVQDHASLNRLEFLEKLPENLKSELETLLESQKNSP